jgi:hypothetical protein
LCLLCFAVCCCLHSLHSCWIVGGRNGTENNEITDRAQQWLKQQQHREGLEEFVI